MNTKKTTFISIATLAVLLSSTPLFAETFLLSSGKSIIGSIISETKESYVIKTETSRNVYGEKTISKIDITKITETDPSIRAFDRLTGILPTADLLSAEEYQSIIVNKLQPFLDNYPDSQHAAEVAEVLKTINAEQSVIQNGGIKLNGKILSKSEIEANKYEIHAQTELKKFVRSVSRERYAAALNTLEKMEKLYPNSIQTRKAQNASLVILPHYSSQLISLRDNVDKIMKRRESSLSTLSRSDRRRTNALFLAKDQTYENLLEKAKSEKKGKWLPINKHFKTPIETNLKLVEGETTRITKAVLEPEIDAGEIYRNITSSLNAGNLVSAQKFNETFKNAKQPEIYTKELQEKINTANAKIVAELKEKEIAEKLAIQKRIEADKLAREKALAAEAEKERLKEDPEKKGPLDRINNKYEVWEKLKQ